MGRRGNEIGSHELAADKVREYILSGRAVVTVQNVETENHLTYEINRKGVDAEKPDDVWFVKILTGDQYTYIGLFNGLKFMRTKAVTISEDAPSFHVFEIIAKRYLVGNNPHPKLRIMHNGHCGKCGRVLTNPESIDTGMGPVCSGRKL